MFSKLRNKFIITNMVITTVILVAAFSGIYFATSVSQQRMPKRDMPKEFPASLEIRTAFEEEMARVRDENLAKLAVTLIVIGALTEILVFAASYYFAEKAIKPVKEAYEGQREFIANASHELKTPIAAARANFEALGTTEQPWTDNVDMELERASNLVNDLLTLARTDGRTEKSKKKDVDLAKLVRKRTQLVEARLGKKKLFVDAPEKMPVNISEADFLQVLDILLDNAVKYSKKMISVGLDEKKLIVTNDGKTIPPEKLTKVFDRFYQTDKTAEGSGLGLAIAAAVVKQNGWKIEAQSDKKTTSFILNF
jgi:signal transduction histidine kinase